MKWAMRLYPPLLLQRIWVIGFDKGFTGVSVRIKKSLLNKNYNGSIFGGTLFSAADPFYPLLFHQLFIRRGHQVIVWLKSADVRYLKPAETSLRFHISLDSGTIDTAEKTLLKDGKFIQTFLIEMFDKHGQLCVTVHAETYVRLLQK